MVNDVKPSPPGKEVNTKERQDEKSTYVVAWEYALLASGVDTYMSC
jgi:hypothetical protein